MKNSKILLLFGVFLSLPFWSCQSKVKKTTSTTAPTTLLQAVGNQAWKASVNQQSNSLAPLYFKNAIKIFPNGNIIEGNIAIDSLYQSRSIVIDSIQVIKKITANKKRGIEYEIGTFWSDNQQFKQLLIWNKEDGITKREVELMAKSLTTSPPNEAINLSRKKWIKLCNEHNAKQLVEQAYTANAIYYNHKPVIVGRPSITEEYQYMNQANYSLHLEPIIVEPVNANLVFEIGQCSGSYKGKYVIIWQKQKDGNWQVLMDSNI